MEKSFFGATKPGSFFSIYNRLASEAVNLTKENFFVEHEPQTMGKPHICLPESRNI